MENQDILRYIDTKKVKKDSIKGYKISSDIYFKIDLGLDDEDSVEPLVYVNNTFKTSQGTMVMNRGIKSKFFLLENQKVKTYEIGAILYKVTRQKTRRNILKILSIKKSINLYQLAKLLKKDYSRVYRHVQGLEKAGIVKTTTTKTNRKEKIVEPLVKFVFSSDLMKLKLDNFDKIKKELKACHKKQLELEEKSKRALLGG